MRLNYLSRVERDLRHAVRCSECASRFKRIMESGRWVPSIGLHSWADVRRRLDEIGQRNPETDPLLASLLAAHKANPDEQWQAITLFLFLSPLTTIYRCLRRHDPDEDTHCSQVLWAFLCAVDHLNLSQRDSGLGKKLLNDTQHEVRRFYAHERAGWKIIRSMHDGEDDDIAERKGGDDLGMARVESDLNRHWTRARMRSLVQSGDLSKPDSLILIGCFLYGYSLHEMAARLGLTYAAAKKQRQRALARLEKCAPHLSPTHPDSPLVMVGQSTERRKPDVQP